MWAQVCVTSKHSRSRAALQTQHACRGRRHLLVLAAGANSTALPSSASTRRAAWGEPILICGAGIAGLATALALTKVGLPVRVLESRPGLRTEGAALSLWANAWRALEALGGRELAEELRRGHPSLTRVEMCSSAGELLRAFRLDECDVGGPGTGATETRGLMRATLLQALYDSLPGRENVVEFGVTVEEVVGPSDGDGGGSSGKGPVVVRLSDGRTAYGSVLVGADGVGSEVARHLQLPPPGYSGYCAYRGVAFFPDAKLDSKAARPKSGSGPGFCSGPGPGGLPLDTIRQMWGSGVRAGMYPLGPDAFYWFTCFNADPEAAARPPGSSAERRRAALESVGGWSPGLGIAAAIAATSPEDISWSRISDRWTYGAFGRGCVTLAGDAAHPMTPNLGQGGCTALEDAVVLARRLGALAAGSSRPPSPDGVAAALRSYEYERSSRCLPLTVRSNLMGAALHISFPPVTAARDAFMRAAFSPAHFLDHTVYDCGRLDEL